MSSIQLSIKRWSAWMPGISTLQDWEEWRQGGKSPVTGADPDVKEIPPMLRRRLSPLGKMAVAVAWPLLRAKPAMPSLFCSRHGELERTASMLQELAAGQALSPTHFSLSVHNAIGGVFSIARGDRSAISALAVSDEGFSDALLEARLIAAEQETREALFLIYDAPPPSVYEEFGHGPQWPYALALVVGPPDSEATHSFSLDREGGNSIIRDTLQAPVQEPQALTFVRFLLDQGGGELRLPSRGDCWHYSRLG